METRNITLTLEKAKEFYNSGNAALKEVALQAFTQEELIIPKFTDIKTFEDAVKALGMDLDNVLCDISHMEAVEGKLGKHLTAIYKLDIIRKALNGADWKPKMTKGNIYYSLVRFYPYNSKPDDLTLKKNNWVLGEKFVHGGSIYILVGRDCSCCGGSGVCNCYGIDGEVVASAGLLCCKSKEIAQHMSEQFGKIIFDACYAQHIDAYKWV